VLIFLQTVKAAVKQNVGSAATLNEPQLKMANHKKVQVEFHQKYSRNHWLNH